MSQLENRIDRALMESIGFMGYTVLPKSQYEYIKRNGIGPRNFAELPTRKLTHVDKVVFASAHSMRKLYKIFYIKDELIVRFRVPSKSNKIKGGVYTTKQNIDPKDIEVVSVTDSGKEKYAPITMTTYDKVKREVRHPSVGAKDKRSRGSGLWDLW